MPEIVIKSGGIEIVCRTRPTRTAQAILDALPLRGDAMTWGDEVYFATGLDLAAEDDARALVDPGEIAFWPEGKAVAIGFGPTPISAPGEVRLAAPCNIWADAKGDVTGLTDVRAGDDIVIERI